MVLSLIRKFDWAVLTPLLFSLPLLGQQAASEQGKVKVEMRTGVVAGEHLEFPPEAVAPMELGLDFPTVKNHPFRAEMIVEVNRRLADGNSVQRTSKAVVYRDRHGRLREERIIQTPASPEREGQEETTVTIKDPRNAFITS